MTAPLLTKNWTITPNLRRTYSSLNDLVSWFYYENKVAILAAGWTVKFSCDGTTGPSSGADTTDRWTSMAATNTRGAAAGNPQSWIVLQNSDGVQIRFAYFGATDDVGTIAFSPGGLYTVAGTTTHAPTATDEVLISSGNSLVNATTSLDRVMSIWVSSDTKHWACTIFRNSALINYIGVEVINNLCSPATIFSADGVTAKPYIGFRYTNAARAFTTGTPINTTPNVAVGAASWTGAACRVYTAATSRLNRIGGGFWANQNIVGSETSGNFSVAVNFNGTQPALQGGNTSPLVPLYWSGERAANLDGILGYPIDWWQMITSALTTPATGDFVPGFDPGDNTAGATRSNWLVCIGSASVRPWRNAAATLEVL